MNDGKGTYFEMLSVQLEAIHPLDRLLRGLWGIITHKTEALALSRLLVNVHFSRMTFPHVAKRVFRSESVIEMGK